MFEEIRNRIKEIEKSVMALVENQQMSLTDKNKLMEPLVDEKKVLDDALHKLEVIKNTDYSGKCTI